MRINCARVVCGLVVRAHDYRSEMYCASCEVRTELICLRTQATEFVCLFCYVEESRPPLWSSGQSSWLQIGDVLCFLWGTNWICICYVGESRPPLWSSGQSSWLTEPEVRIRFSALPDFLRSSGSGTGSTLPREHNWGVTSTWRKK
jgi:hypothetical protein